MDRRGFLQLIGLSATVAVLPTSFVEIKNSEFSRTLMPNRRKARALSGLADVSKFKVYVESTRRKWRIDGSPKITEGDGFLYLKFPEWISNINVRINKMTLVDDENCIIAEKELNTDLLSGDTFVFSYTLTV